MFRGKSASEEFLQILDAGLSYELFVSDGWLPWCWLDNIIPLLYPGLPSVQAFHLHDPINGTSQCAEAKVQVRNLRISFWTQASHMSQLCLMDGSHGFGLTKLNLCCIQGYIMSKHFTSMTPSMAPVNIQGRKCK